jgi:hypothetical protein
MEYFVLPSSVLNIYMACGTQVNIESSKEQSGKMRSLQFSHTSLSLLFSYCYR